MKWALLLAVCASAMAEDAIVLTFEKSFPGSTPAYVWIQVTPGGKAVYKEAPDDDRPLPAILSPAEYKQMVALAEKLGRFTRPLESPAKVAKMGMKTFRYEAGSVKNEVQFNFSEDLDARALLEWFEKISESAQLYGVLERTVKYDKLGVNKALLQLESAMERKHVVSPRQYLPLLDRVVKNESYLHMARARAAGLAEAIRATPEEGAAQ